MSTTTTARVDSGMTVASIATEYPDTLAIFNKYNIDYCCGGHRSLKEACLRIGLDHEKVLGEIRDSVSDKIPTTFRAQEWSSSLLIDYILENHHAYVRNAIPEIQALLEKVCNVHGHDNLELRSIKDDFDNLAAELFQHMQKEELILFPAIKRLEANAKNEYPLAITIQAPVDAMEHEHETAGKLIKSIRTQSRDYTPPDYACPTFRITYKRLQEFENDLMAHIHLENNILFERVKERAQPTSSCSLPSNCSL